MRETTYFSKWGGEEFLLVYKLGYEDTVAKTRLLRESILAHDFTYEGTKMNITMTFGVADGTEYIRYENVIKKADEKLYVGKNNGRNQVVA